MLTVSAVVILVVVFRTSISPPEKPLREGGNKTDLDE